MISMTLSNPCLDVSLGLDTPLRSGMRLGLGAS